jgi:16S rRNA G966 N2-methylase RsmD
MSVIQISLFPEMDIVNDNSSTFEDNMKMPIHRWYRYTAGFSASWVAQLLEKEGKNKHLRVIDPFVGSGTVALESVFHNVDAIGFESNPYVNRIANAKLAWRTIDIENLKRTALMPKHQLRSCHLILP